MQTRRRVDAPSPPPLSISELAWVLVRLEHAVNSVAAGFRVGMYAVCGLFVAIGLAYAIAFGMWSVCAIGAVFATGIGWLGRVAARKTSPAQMRPVLDAVRDAPAQISSLRHYTTSDSRRMFVSHWVEVRTATHRLIAKTDDWHQLLALLARRCPGATVQRA